MELLNQYVTLFNTLELIDKVIFLIWTMCVIVFTMSYIIFWYYVVKSKTNKIKWG